MVVWLVKNLLNHSVTSYYWSFNDWKPFFFSGHSISEILSTDALCSLVCGRSVRKSILFTWILCDSSGSSVKIGLLRLKTKVMRNIRGGDNDRKFFLFNKQFARWRVTDLHPNLTYGITEWNDSSIGTISLLLLLLLLLLISHYRHTEDLWSTGFIAFFDGVFSSLSNEYSHDRFCHKHNCVKVRKNDIQSHTIFICAREQVSKQPCMLASG